MSKEKEIQNQEKARARIIERLKTDLLGPINPNEKITSVGGFLENPRTRYLTGVLYPINTRPGEDETAGIVAETGGDMIGTANSFPVVDTKLPSTIGLSFFIDPKQNGPISLNVDIEGGIYKLNDDEDPEKKFWERKPLEKNQVIEIPFDEKPSGYSDTSLDPELKNFEIYCRWETNRKLLRNDDTALIQCTLVLVNRNRHDEENDEYHELVQKSLFQSKFRIRVKYPSIIASVPEIDKGISDTQAKLNSLLYRNAKEYAKGHTCSAAWETDINGNCLEIRTTWIPNKKVNDTNLEGNKSIKEKIAAVGFDGYEASTLAKLAPDKLKDFLLTVPDSYSAWISKQDNLIDNHLEDRHKDSARKQSEYSRDAIRRMKVSIDLISSDIKVLESFKLANEAIEKQYFWQHGKHLNWRPFQLAFILLTIESVLKGDSNERNVMDLLWFPTGGGKTEAYLFLIAALLFYRRLENGSLDSEDGVAIITRYTLRALTTDQFSRTSRLICACELIRQKKLVQLAANQDSSPFSIGLWIGVKATPNKLWNGEEPAIKRGRLNPKVNQLSECPCCKGTLKWDFIDNKDEKAPIRCHCKNEDCELGSKLRDLPIHTVDEQIYKVSPSVLIGTVDKFITITQKPETTKSLFNLDSGKPPDLIIQDELHLISGPLGSITGIFETTIDVRCTLERPDGSLIVPKIIGSTATIQQANEQIKSLYNRSAFTFPIPVTEASDTFFSEINASSPGRIYLGLSTAGRTATYMSSVAGGSLMQSRKDQIIMGLGDKERDPFTTLAVYFNSLRELGGARTHLQEDAQKARDVFARMYGETPMQLKELTELTSNVSQEELRQNLDNLKRSENQDGHIDVLLASSMISVGIDIPRLGLMMVQGQPKTMSEYIQATSRVGRGSIPGVILTIYNSYKVRDRNFFESFKTWHSSFYKHVESTSVTPFSARSRDKVLPSLIVSLAYKFIDDMTESDVELTYQRRSEVENKVMPIILNRVNQIDPDEHDDTRNDILDFLEKWEARGRLEYLWNDWKSVTKSLLISTDKSTMIRAQGYDGKLPAIPAPTSARDVEPKVSVVLRDERLKN